ncbi:nickel pincer cofactor biosynthesis protein LarC [Fundidesulfovibrio terrae]|uniref:nickel pincer cofactor biosynthesis protein LarC n=1 Tax=Fundidesulfovibrio terrae TaxID=2922866 RepID=UPI001FAF9FC3|nr:nickel pincer cofactor biosynthesis protein LarC [Fundidesulfovibrio terrae]
MKILYYDCFAGISGDMNLAAMIDLGVEPGYLRAELSKLGLDHEFELAVAADSRHGIHGTRVDVVLKHDDASHGHVHSLSELVEEHAHHHTDSPVGHAHAHGDSPHGHHHGHADAPEEHGHGHGHEGAPHGHHHGHAGSCGGHAHGHVDGQGAHQHGHAAHRNLADIESVIMGSALAHEVKLTSLAIFRKVAEAEAKVHGKALHEVHFHEVGATDSIVDIVGAAICFHRLGVDAVWASPVELGGGFVRCAHGLIPVPAPATVEILHGIPTTRGAVKHETATPTGAAILAALVDKFTATPALVTEKTAYGIGHRDAAIPNVLRVHLARAASSRPVGTVQDARLLQCNIDDMTAEMLGVAMDLLMENGAMDVHFTPIQMKKNRPATCVSLLCSAADEERFKDLLFRHTTTLGIKSFPLDKTVLDISFERLDTPLGAVTMKNAIRHGKVVRSKPELEDCREMARRHDMPLSDVYALIGRHRKERSS